MGVASLDQILPPLQHDAVMEVGPTFLMEVAERALSRARDLGDGHIVCASANSMRSDEFSITAQPALCVWPVQEVPD